MLKQGKKCSNKGKMPFCRLFGEKKPNILRKYSFATFGAKTTNILKRCRSGTPLSENNDR